MMGIDLTSIGRSKAFCRFLGVEPETQVDFRLLGHGEYNLNYLFHHPHTGDKLVLRIPVGSQMHLDNQVRYEFQALKLLERSGRTPKPLYLDDTKTAIPHGFLVMNYLPGRPLRYESDLDIGAQILADIHNLEIPTDNHLICPGDPLQAVLDECNAMAGHYLDSDIAPGETKKLITALLGRGNAICGSTGGRRCLINTELNSGNFLVGGSDGGNYLVDWEKPLYAFAAQDLGHFLAPTTTFWKTDTILGERAIRSFLVSYCRHSAHNRDPEALWRQVFPYFTMTCLRGITWCAMAWVEYQSPQRLLRDSFTYEKIQAYLTPEFLERIKEEYLGG